MSSFPSRRLKGRDYASPGRYFVTICSDFKRCIFGTVERGTVNLSKLGQLAEEALLALAQQFRGIQLHGHMVSQITYTESSKFARTDKRSKLRHYKERDLT